MRARLLSLVLWLARWCGWREPEPVDYWGIPEIMREVVPAALYHCSLEAIASPDTSGEWKRHQVYAKLQKQFPDLPHRDLGLAIELALRS